MPSLLRWHGAAPCGRPAQRINTPLVLPLPLPPNRSNLLRKKQHRHSGIFRVAHWSLEQAKENIRNLRAPGGASHRVAAALSQNADCTGGLHCQSRRTTSPSQLSTSPPGFRHGCRRAECCGRILSHARPQFTLFSPLRATPPIWSWQPKRRSSSMEHGPFPPHPNDGGILYSGNKGAWEPCAVGSPGAGGLLRAITSARENSGPDERYFPLADISRNSLAE